MSRSSYKNPFKKNFINNKNIYSRNEEITPEHIEMRVNIYNGEKFISRKIKENMMGFKFGDFIRTRKRCRYKTKNKKWVKK